MTDTVTVPLSWLDRLLGRKEEPEPVQEQTPVPQASQEDYAAKFKASAEQVELLEAQIAQMQSDQNRAGRVAQFASQLPAEAGDIHEMLADLEPEVAEAVATRFKALYAQIEQQPDKDVGKPGQPDELGIDPVKALNEAVMQYAHEHQVSYPDAFHTVTSTNPDLLDEYLRGAK